MTEQDRDAVLRDLNRLVNEPGGAVVVAHILNVAGAFLPGFSSIAAMSGEVRQSLVNESMALWASLADAQIEKIKDSIAALSK